MVTEIILQLDVRGGEVRLEPLKACYIGLFKLQPPDSLIVGILGLESSCPLRPDNAKIDCHVDRHHRKGGSFEDPKDFLSTLSSHVTNQLPDGDSGPTYLAVQTNAISCEPPPLPPRTPWLLMSTSLKSLDPSRLDRNFSIACSSFPITTNCTSGLSADAEARARPLRRAEGGSNPLILDVRSVRENCLWLISWFTNSVFWTRVLYSGRSIWRRRVASCDLRAFSCVSTSPTDSTARCARPI